MENLKQTLFFDHETEKEKKIPSQKIPLLLIHLFISPDNKTKQERETKSFASSRPLFIFTKKRKS